MSNKSIYDPSSAVEAALAKLAKFTEENATEATPHVFYFNTSAENKTASFALGRVFQKEVKMIRSCIAAIFSTETRHMHDQMRKEVQNDLLDAIGVIKNHYRYIYQLPKHQALVTRFFSTITAFNALITEKSPEQPKSFWHSIRSYLCHAGGLSITKELTCNKIILPSLPASNDEDKNTSSLSMLSRRFLIRSKAPEMQKVSTLFQNSQKIAMEQDHELFWMKALSLLKPEFFESDEEKFESVKQSPIFTNLTPCNSQEKEEPSWILEMQQILAPLPGEKIIIKGQLKKGSQPSSRSVPVQNSFTLTTISNLAGFPYCAQYNGSGFTEVLIPKCPHRLDLLPLTAPLLEWKLETTQKLATDEQLLSKVRQLYRLKKKAFNNHRMIFLNLHEKLCLKLIEKIQDEEKTKIISDYFMGLREHKNPYDSLSDTYQAINDYFINKPYARLQNASIDGSGFSANLLETQIHEIFSQQEKSENPMEKSALKFILVIGTLLGERAKQIMLQEFSEIMQFSPKALDLDAQRMQMGVYHQLLSFRDELRMSEITLDSTFEMLKTYLENDIALLSGSNSNLVGITEELQQYFQIRYQARKVKDT